MDKLIRPVFTLELNYKIVPNLVTIGKYDGTHPCVTAATTADKVLIHSPHRRNAVVTGRIVWSESNKEIATLNVNETISSLCTGQFLPDDEKDVLIIGTETNVLAYHVHDNKDVFFKECPDGVKSLALGSFRDHKTQILMVGGNSSVHGYNHKGEEVFWTAVGDVVTSIILMDYNKDGMNELIVSSEDFNIRVFKGDQVLAELVETEVVTNLVALPDNRFAYSVSNGTVGVYEQELRLWRVKSKNFAISLRCYDLLGQSSLQLITGWSNGKIDCRSVKTGEVFFKDVMNSGLAGIVEGDYRSNGKTDLICISMEGEVKGYSTTKTLPTIPGVGNEQDTVRMLLAQKQALITELKHYENNTKYNETAMSQTESFESHGVIPANTRLQIAINTNEGKKNVKPHVEIYVATNNTTIIRAIMIFAEGIFKGETHVVHPSTAQLKSELSVPLFLLKDTPVDIHIKALVGYPNSIQFHVFEVTRQLPRFSMYSLQRHNFQTKPKEYVEFKVNERIQRICMWINQNFLFSSDLEFESGPSLVINLKNLRNDQEIVLVFEISGKVVFYADNMTLASDLVQSLAAFLNLDNLESTANYPSEEENLRNLMEKLQEIQDARLRLGTDIADRLGQIRTLVIRAEDARLNDIKEMPKYYTELMGLNKEIINGHNIRLQNYNDGVDSMKKINAIIQRASRLRVGQTAANMINHCRTAIKNNNVDGLIKIIRTGEI
ncbi:Bardet-Biedl syndrome 2 protein [Aethina tumida]|uniref:Bardet-Biedl syndrome 2 protein n=1 Tax=Aethina tumida TaxID=116153 RepID=UPI00096B475F|nr:Bardet-Biedl syndrome 2 protein [Aethina tumida]